MGSKRWAGDGNGAGAGCNLGMCEEKTGQREDQTAEKAGGR